MGVCGRGEEKAKSVCLKSIIMPKTKQNKKKEFNKYYKLAILKIQRNISPPKSLK